MTHSTTTEPCVLFAEFTARDGASETIAALLSQYALKVRLEPGNIRFDCYRYADNPARFFVFESYVDEESFQAHLAATYGAEFNQLLAPLIVEPKSVLTFLQTLGSRGSA